MAAGRNGVETPAKDDACRINVGYWLGRDYWKQDFMSEALGLVIDITFAHAYVAVLTATTDPVNRASQHVLRKGGLRCVGLFPRRDPAALRGRSL